MDLKLKIWEFQILLRRRNLLFTIAGKHIEITEKLRIYAQEKTSRLPRYYNSIGQIDVIIEREARRDKKIGVEIIARAKRRRVFVATEAGNDVQVCIDAAVHKLEQRLRKIKTKERDRKHSARQ
jgi:putative sigma-54 modulation protein